jgi:ubiquitin-protein ligase
MTTQKYNPNSANVKRILQEVRDMEGDPDASVVAAPLDDDLFEWHFTVRGPAGTPYEGGLYHGRLVLPTEYPLRPPTVMLLTANGRFEVGVKICLNASSYHPEEWKPSWSIKTLLVAIVAFMPTKGEGALGSIEMSAEQRKDLAKRSLQFKCSRCGMNHETLPKPEPQPEPQPRPEPTIPVPAPTAPELPAPVPDVPAPAPAPPMAPSPIDEQRRRRVAILDGLLATVVLLFSLLIARRWVL